MWLRITVGVIDMHIEELDIEGAWVVTPQIHGDDRGAFLEWFRSDRFREATGHDLKLTQANCSVSARGTVRGSISRMCRPARPKYVTCVSGSALDVIVDIRVGSPTYGKWTAVPLDAESRRAVYLSEGLGHGFAAPPMAPRSCTCAVRATHPPASTKCTRWIRRWGSSGESPTSRCLPRTLRLRHWTGPGRRAAAGLRQRPPFAPVCDGPACGSLSFIASTLPTSPVVRTRSSLRRLARSSTPATRSCFLAATRIASGCSAPIRWRRHGALSRTAEPTPVIICARSRPTWCTFTTPCRTSALPGCGTGRRLWSTRCNFRPLCANALLYRGSQLHAVPRR